jgi:hypothetical protein
MLGRLALVATKVSEEHIAFIIWVTRIGVFRLLDTTNFVPSLLILVTDDGGDMLLRNVGSYKSHTA